MRVKLHDIPCAVEVEGARATDGDESEDVAVEAEGALKAPAHHGDVVQRSQRQPSALRRLDALGVHHLSDERTTFFDGL